MHVVLLATDPSEAHGWSNHARELIGALAAHGVQLTLITSRHAAARDLPNTTIQRCLPSLSEPSRALSLRLLAANWLGKLYRHVYRRAQIICVSRYTERRVRAILPDVRTHVIPNGVNLARFAQPSGVSVPKRAPTVLSVGQIKPRKGFLEIAEAMALVRGQIPEAEAVFIGNTQGDPAYVARLRARIAALGLSQAVHLLGKLPEPELLAWYAAADVFALHSLNLGQQFEGFGLVYLEASAAGLPVIGTRECGAEDAIRDGETGFLVQQGDVAALAAHLVRLLRDADLRRQLGAAGRAFAAQHTWEATARQVLARYEDALTVSRRR
jgi:glycosyltransferase involved in cell wall biosynthesis